MEMNRTHDSSPEYDDVENDFQAAADIADLWPADRNKQVNGFRCVKIFQGDDPALVSYVQKVQAAGFEVFPTMHPRHVTTGATNLPVRVWVKPKSS